MKASDVRAKTQDQLTDDLASLKKEQFNLRFQKATGQLEKTARVKIERRFTHPVMKKTVRQTKKYKAHDETNAHKVGDMVFIQESKPISKDKRWIVITEQQAQ